MSLFADLVAAKDAVISECLTYRYRLTRTWDAECRRACFIMLNPSTADAVEDDPTIRRCVGFAKSWGCGGIVVVNLYALRATDPKNLWSSHAPKIGPDNDWHIREAAQECFPVVCAWGIHGARGGRDRSIALLLQSWGVLPKCLGVTKDGHPRHPLYVKSDQGLMPFEVSHSGS